MLGCNWESSCYSGGVHRRVFNSAPIAYREGTIWKRIVNTWENSGISERPHIVTKAPFMISVADDGMRRVHPTKEVDRYVEIGPPYVKIGDDWQRVGFSGASRHGNCITWSRQQADLSITMGGHFVKLAIELKNGYVPPDSQLAFPVGMQGLTRSGGTILADGVPVMRVAAPCVYDADDPIFAKPVDWRFVHVNNQWHVLLTLPDVSGMARPIVDPTLILQPSSADTYILDALPNTNYGGNAYLGIGESNTAAQVYRTLIKFDLSSLSDNAIISSATLSLYCTTDKSWNARTARVYRQKRAWVEAQATWNIYNTGNNWATAGGFGADDCEQSDIGSRAFAASEAINEFKDWPLTATTKAELDLGNGYLMKMDTEDNDEYAFASNNYVTEASRPKMTIVYTFPGAFAHVMM